MVTPVLRAAQGCQFCGGNQSEPRFNRLDAPWDYEYCFSCRSLTLKPLPTPEELRDFYNRQYRVDPTGYARNMKRLAPRFLAAMEALTEGRTLLEVGCSYGNFLCQARERGWQVAGVEISEEAARAARSKGLKVYSGLLAERMEELGCGQWSAVCLWHVVEHVPDVHALMDDIFRLLSPGGVVLLRTPNAAGWGAKVFRGHWQWSIKPAHVSLFSPEGLTWLLDRHGFTDVHTQAARGEAQTFLAQIVSSSVRFFKKTREWASAPESRGSGSTRWTERVYRRALYAAVMIGIPLDWLLRLNCGKLSGSELFVSARKA
ncbi:MAG: class I SAM-dependent methyltransferase [Terriglobales bacterium]